VGQSLIENTCQNNPYQAWIDTYSGTDFQQQVEKLLEHIEHFAVQVSTAEQQKMIDSFLVSSLLELCFWEAIYRRRSIKSTELATKDTLAVDLPLILLS
jgi:thiaminase/transcriptional activator TenA